MIAQAVTLLVIMKKILNKLKIKIMKFKLTINTQFRAILIKDLVKKLKLIHLLKVDKKDLNKI